MVHTVFKTNNEAQAHYILIERPAPQVAEDAYVRNREYDDLEDDIDELSLREGHHREQQRTVQLMEVVEDYYPCSALELPVREGRHLDYVCMYVAS